MGIAVMGAILTSRESSALSDGANQAQAFIDGFSTSLEVAAVIAFLGAMTAALLIRRPPLAEAATATGTVPA